MTDRPLATTRALYCGADFFAADVRADLLAYVQERCPSAFRPTLRRPILRDNEPLGELYLSLARTARDYPLRDYPAHLDNPEAFLERLRTAWREARRFNNLDPEFADLDGALLDLDRRLALYRLELGDREAVDVVRHHAVVLAQAKDDGGKVGSELLDLILGLSLYSTMPGRTLPRDPRSAICAFARYTFFRTAGPQVEIEELDEEQDIDLAGPSLLVLASVEHLPGSATAGQTPRHTSTPRGEFAPMAGVRLPLVHDVDVQAVAESLRAEWPWATAVVEAMLNDLVASPFAHLRPTLLLGPPGAGKTRLARRIAELCGLPVTIYACAGVSDSALGGTSRQWSTGRANLPLQTIKGFWTANPLIVLDEIEKAGTRVENGRLVDALIPMLETESAARFFDPYVECAVDLSAVSYVATANSLAGIPGPLLDRLRVLRVPEPGAEHVTGIAQRMLAEIRHERGTDERWTPDFDGEEMALLGDRWQGGSLRQLRRLVEVLVAGRDALAPRH